MNLYNNFVVYPYMYIWSYKGRSIRRYIVTWCVHGFRTLQKYNNDWIPLTFRTLSHVPLVTSPIHSLYCNIFNFCAESHRYITNRQIFCLFVCLFVYLLLCRNSKYCEQKVNLNIIDRNLLRCQHHLRVHRGEHHQAGTAQTSSDNNIHAG